MTELKRFVFNSFQVNTFVLYDDSRECVIIDAANYTASENAELESFIQQKSLHPVFHINTHCHIDHVVGIHWVRNRYEIPSFAHESEVPLLNNVPLMGELYGFDIASVPPLDGYISDNQTLQFGNTEVQALHVPGHSEGSLAFFSSDGGFVMSGDALFAGSIGRTDLPGGDYDTLIESIRKRLFSLPGSTIVWPGHGPSSSVMEEMENNPFFNT